MVGSTIGERIRHARKMLRLTRPELASRIGTTETTLYRWEAGVHEPKREFIEALSRELGVSAQTLVWGMVVARPERSGARRRKPPMRRFKKKSD
jgi:transcriptional regulator with XRE-family HTH domain